MGSDSIQALKDDYVFCYLDILGLKQAFKDDPEKAYDYLIRFRENFLKWFGHDNSPWPKPEMEFFSDTIIIYTKYDADIFDNLIDPILASVVCAFTNAIQYDFTFRGSITIGKAKKLADEDGDCTGIVGPVFEEVYLLESQLAIYPRIVLGKKLRDKIQSSTAKKWINTDMDGIDQIDIFCRAHSELLSKMNDGNDRKTKDFITEIAKKIEDKYDEHSNKNTPESLKISSKWGYLLQYLRQSYIGEVYLNNDSSSEQ